MAIWQLSPQWHATWDLMHVLARHRQLIWEMAKRELSDRYAGQVLGALWAVCHPLIQMGIYLMVFTLIGRGAGGAVAATLSDPAFLLAGIIPWLVTQDALNRATTAITANASLVKQVVFPLEVLPAKAILVTLVPQAVALTLLIGYLLGTGRGLPWTYAVLPAIVACHFLGMLGLAYGLSALGTAAPDLREVVQVFSLVGLYLVPVFYQPEWLGRYVWLLYLNPFTHVILCYQDACCTGAVAHPWSWLALLAGSVLSFGLGYRVFRRGKAVFGNLL